MIAHHYLQPDAKSLDDASAKEIAVAALITIGGMSLYGFSVGFWRSPLMGAFVAVKMPLLIFLTLACNGLLNGLFGILLGAGFAFRQSLLALLNAFAVAALILGSLAPVTFLLALNAPAPDAPGAVTAHAAYLLTHTWLIACGGIMANIRLHQVLAAKAASRFAANATLIAWLAGNGFLGAQFSWILRPFFGSPHLEVAFLRADPMRGNFYQSVWHSFERITHGQPIPIRAILTIFASLLFSVSKHLTSNRKRYEPRRTH